jgi:peptide/nickel transport system substrate-binding protein
MIYDTPFGTDENGKVKPQMVDSWTESKDNRLWTFKLRKGLEFRDGKPVTGDDVIASLQRWAKREVGCVISMSLLNVRQATEELTCPLPAIPT